MGRAAIFNPDRWQPQQLSSRYKEIMRLDLMGYKANDIADAIGLSNQIVSMVRNSDLYMQKMAEMQQVADNEAMDVAVEIQQRAGECMQVLGEIMRNTEVNPAVRANIAKDGLDRAGYAPVKRFQASVAHAMLTPEDIEELKRRALEQRNNGGNGGGAGITPTASQPSASDADSNVIEAEVEECQE